MMWAVFGPGDDPTGWTGQQAADEQEARQLAADLGEPFHALELESPGDRWIQTSDGSYDYR